jgi:hypothetical protein
VRSLSVSIVLVNVYHLNRSVFLIYSELRVVVYVFLSGISSLMQINGAVVSSQNYINLSVFIQPKRFLEEKWKSELSPRPS